MFTLSHADSHLADFPCNCLFYDTETVRSIAGSADESEELRICCIAELFRRRFLNPRGVAPEILDTLLPNGERDQIERYLGNDFLRKPDRQMLEGPLWGDRGEFSRKCRCAVRKMLIKLCCETDGFIPVYMEAEEKAYFVPFHLEDGDPGIFDAAGAPVDEWQSCCRALLGSAGCRCIVDCDQRGLPELEGNSLMLPLYLALRRRQGVIAYDPLRLLATGAIVDGKIAAVETAEKSAELVVCFGEAKLLFPESSRYCAGKHWEVPLVVGTKLEDLDEKVRRLVEARGLHTPTFGEAAGRLRQLVRDRESNYSMWQIMMDRLENNAKVIPAWRSPELHLICLMLRSSIFCHMGKAKEALEVNAEAKKFARECGMENHLRRLEIEELVEFQDEERFDVIADLSAQLRENMKSWDDPDLLMRGHGTLGQLHGCGFLAGVPGFDREFAKVCLDRALNCACQLDSPGDIAQDLNYRFQWYALFEPETSGALRAYEEAREHITRELEGEGKQKNRYFLQRIKAFSLYRRNLMGGDVSGFDAKELLLPEDADPWLRALTCKCAGALEAAAGRTEEAKRLFEEALGLEKNLQAPILRLIFLTVLCEAWHSLGDEEYRRRALKIAAELVKPFPGSGGMWKNYLESAADFPALKYWY